MHTFLHVIQTTDVQLVRLLSQYAHQDRAFDTLVYDVADSSLLKGGLFMAYFWWLWFRADKNAEKTRAHVIVALAGGLIAVFVSRIMQVTLPDHTRPLQDPTAGFVVPYGVNPDTLNHWSSFPSDHAALFMALSVGIALHRPILGVLAATWTLFAICLPRVYLGFHYPSDIVAGALLGAAIMLATHYATRSALWPRRVVALAPQHRKAFYTLAFLATYEMTVLFYDLRALSTDSFHVFKSMIAASASQAHAGEIAIREQPTAPTK